jgi:hypothetical protein
VKVEDGARVWLVLGVEWVWEEGGHAEYRSFCWEELSLTARGFFALLNA